MATNCQIWFRYCRIYVKIRKIIYVAFTCQQAIEKLVKALHVLYTENEAPKTHNILYVFELIFNNEENSSKVPDKNFKEIRNKYSSLFTRLHSYYIAARYTDYKRKISESLDKKICAELLKETKEAFKWLTSLKIL